MNKEPARGRCTQAKHCIRWDGYVHLLRRSEKLEHSKRAEARGAPRQKMRIDESEASSQVGPPAAGSWSEAGLSDQCGSPPIRLVDPWAWRASQDRVYHETTERESERVAAQRAHTSARSSLRLVAATSTAARQAWQALIPSPFLVITSSTVTTTNPSRLQQRVNAPQHLDDKANNGLEYRNVLTREYINPINNRNERCKIAGKE